MFNELSINNLNTILDARIVLETFVKSSIRAKEFGFNELRLHESSLQSLYNLSLIEGYRIDNWLNDKEVSFDLRDSFREIITTFPLINPEDISEMELSERSEFSKTIDDNLLPAFGLGAAYVYGTLAISLATHHEWLKSSVSIKHYLLNNEGNESTIEVAVFHFSSKDILETHKKWIVDQQKEILEKSIDLWVKREEYFPNILLGTDLEWQLQKIGLSKKFYQVVDCLKKLDAFAKTWVEGGFDLNELRAFTLLNISGESDSTMRKYSSLRKFRLHDEKKAQFEFHIKIPDIRIYFLSNEVTHKIIVGYIGKHLRTSSFD